MSCVLSIIVSHVVLERRHEKRSGKELVLLTSLALGGGHGTQDPLQQNITTFQKEGV